jgi:ABC-2 type transport system ATP-binding protein
VHELTGVAIARGSTVADLTVTRPSLEDVYLELTGAADAAGEPAGVAHV